MKQINNLLPTSELPQSNDNRPYVVKMAEWRNNDLGHLNDNDGIDCPLCKNKGVIFVADPPNPVLSQKSCECMIKRNSIRYAKESGLDKLLEHRISTYTAKDHWQTAIKNIAIEYVHGKHNEWFCLLGQSGAGKTHICSAITKTYIDESVETKYVVWNSFVRELKADMLEDRQMIHKYQTVPVLYIDDLFKGRYTDTDVTLAFDLINYRYNNHLTTIITSELSFSGLMSIDTAIAGRIKERCGKFFIEIEKDVKKNHRLK